MLSTRQASADDKQNISQKFKKCHNFGISWSYLESPWEMHSNKYKYDWHCNGSLIREIDINIWGKPMLRLVSVKQETHSKWCINGTVFHWLVVRGVLYLACKMTADSESIIHFQKYRLAIGIWKYGQVFENVCDECIIIDKCLWYNLCACLPFFRLWDFVCSFVFPLFRSDLLCLHWLGFSVVTFLFRLFVCPFVVCLLFWLSKKSYLTFKYAVAIKETYFWWDFRSCCARKSQEITNGTK